MRSEERRIAELETGRGKGMMGTGHSGDQAQLAAVLSKERKSVCTQRIHRMY